MNANVGTVWISLSGGGAQGLFTIRLLHHLAPRLEMWRAAGRVRFSGTSIGGILALVLASDRDLESSLEQAAPVFRKTFHPVSEGLSVEDWPLFGPSLGPRVDIPLSLSRPRFSTSALRCLLEDWFEDRTLSDLRHPVSVPVLNLQTSEVCVLRHDCPITGRFRVVDVALATSAAPTFFRVHKVGGVPFGDAGQVANAPDALVWADAVERGVFRWSDDVRMLSLGTATRGGEAVSASDSPRMGVWHWVLNQKILKLSMASQQSANDRLCRAMLGLRHCVLDRSLSRGSDLSVGFSRADRRAQSVLWGWADEVWADAEEGLETFLSADFPPPPLWVPPGS